MHELAPIRCIQVNYDEHADTYNEHPGATHEDWDTVLGAAESNGSRVQRIEALEPRWRPYRSSYRITVSLGPSTLDLGPGWSPQSVEDRFYMVEDD